MASSSSAMFLIGTSRADGEHDAAIRRVRAPRARSDRPGGTAGHPRPSAPLAPAGRASPAGAPPPSRRRRARRPAADRPVYRGCGAPGKLITTGMFAAPQPRRLMQRMGVDDVGPGRPGGNPSPRRAAEPLFVQVQRRHGQAAEAARVLPAVHGVAQVRRAEHRRRSRLRTGCRAPPTSNGCTGNDVDVDAERRELAHPRQVPRLAAASHHGEAPHQHRHAHARARGLRPVDMTDGPRARGRRAPRCAWRDRAIPARAAAAARATSPARVQPRWLRPRVGENFARPADAALRETSAAAARRSRASDASSTAAGTQGSITSGTDVWSGARRHGDSDAAPRRAR